MNRRLFIEKIGAAALLSQIGLWELFARDFAQNGLSRPATAYINWAAYDELSDTVMLTGNLAIRQLHEVIRFRKAGAAIEYYLMDMFWFDPDGGYRIERKDSWSKGLFDQWLNDCFANGIKPGLWFSTNTVSVGPKKFIHPAYEWMDSLNRQGSALCLFHGGYLGHLMQTLQIWYNRGVKMFKFDFANFGAATPELEELLTAEEIRQQNITAWQTALKLFKKKNPDAVLVAYNGYGGQQSGTSSPFVKSVDLKWLEAFDALYCGDPRPSDVAMPNFWRSKDLYSDHMVFQYLANGVPAPRIDNTAFMIGNTGTCYYRGKAAWKGMLLLSLARGGWLNTYYGDLSLLNNEEAIWFGKAQKLFLPLQENARFSILGEFPGKGLPYGFVYETKAGNVSTLINPSCESKEIPFINAFKNQMILFTDSGFKPELKFGSVLAGPGQLVVVGTGIYAAEKYLLGIGDDFPVPDLKEIKDITWDFNGNKASASFIPKAPGKIHLTFSQKNAAGVSQRSTAGPNEKIGSILKIRVKSAEEWLSVALNYDKVIWSGLSWAWGTTEIDTSLLNKPLQIEMESQDSKAARLECRLFVEMR